MISLRSMKMKTALLVAGACLFGLAIAGCDEYVQITRDPDVRIHRGETWAWRPEPEPRAARDRDNRRILSRDTIGRNDNRGEAVERDAEANSQIVRDRVKNSIAQALTAKGLTEVSDPGAAEFLVDYHFAVERHNQTVQTVYPGGGYPGVVCGPFRCWEAWGWGRRLATSTSAFKKERSCLTCCSDRRSMWSIERSGKSRFGEIPSV
jgi:Domain of unknown function (DUF4136)